MDCCSPFFDVSVPGGPVPLPHWHFQQSLCTTLLAFLHVLIAPLVSYCHCLFIGLRHDAHTHTGRCFFFFLIKNKEEFYNVNVRFKMSLLSFKYLLKTFKGLPLHWKRFWSIESLAVENEISQEVDFWKQWLICFHWSQESKITIHSVW